MEIPKKSLQDALKNSHENPLLALIQETMVDWKLPSAKSLFELANQREIQITFGIAADADLHLFGQCGSYWMSAFKYPKQGDVVEVEMEDGSREPFEVKFAGLFTFSLVRS